LKTITVVRLSVTQLVHSYSVLSNSIRYGSLDYDEFSEVAVPNTRFSTLVPSVNSFKSHLQRMWCKGEFMFG